MYTIKSLLKKAVNMLKEAEIETAILDAELILAYVLGCDRLKLITDRDRVIGYEISDKFLKLIEDRRLAKPVQYIIGRQEFMGIDFYISPSVLIPRADTEIIVEKVLEKMKHINDAHIIDMCTGSGAIGISLAKFMPEANVYAVDISEEACLCCSINIKNHRLEDRVRLFRGDLFEPLKDLKLEGKIDAVVSNPPYIPSEDIKTLSVNVRNYEPHLALDGGSDGLDFYRRITVGAAPYIKTGGILAFEIGYNEGQDVKAIMERSGYYKDVEIYKDLAGLDRCVIGVMGDR